MIPGISIQRQQLNFDFIIPTLKIILAANNLNDLSALSLGVKTMLLSHGIISYLSNIQVVMSTDCPKYMGVGQHYYSTISQIRTRALTGVSNVQTSAIRLVGEKQVLLLVSIPSVSFFLRLSLYLSVRLSFPQKIQIKSF